MTKRTFEEDAALVKNLVEHHLSNWCYPHGLVPNDVIMNETVAALNEVLDFEGTMPQVSFFFSQQVKLYSSERYKKVFRDSFITLSMAVGMAYGQFAPLLTTYDVATYIREELMAELDGRELKHTLPPPLEGYDKELVQRPVVISFACIRSKDSA